MANTRVAERVVACHDSTWTYLCAGEGPPLVWLHGLWGEPGWELHHQRLAERYTVYAPALPGYHGSSFPPWMVDVEDAATLVIDFLETLTLVLTGACLPLHNPITIAEEIAMVDHLSGGRLIWGALRGAAIEYMHFGVNVSESQGRFREAFHLIKKILTTEGPFSHAGRYYSVRNYNIWPKPLQQPHPKVWMACNSLDSLDFAVETRSYVMTPWVPLTQSAFVYESYHKLAQQQECVAPTDFDDMFAGICAIYCAESDAQARTEAEEHVHTHFTKALAAFDSNTMSLIPGHMTPQGMRTWLAATSGKGGQSLVFGFEEALQNGTLIVGSPRTCIDLIRRQRMEGKRGTLLAMFQFGSLPHSLAMKSIALFGKEVLPAIREV